MLNKRLTRISKFLAFVLRHSPESIGMQLDSEGWLNVEELVKNANATGKSITVQQVRDVITKSDDTLFVLSDDRLRIRAC